MSKVKKIIIGVLVTALILGGVAAGLMRMGGSNETEVMVASVGSIASNYYTSNTTLDGQIATNVSQNVVVDKDMIVQEVYVSQGDNVSKGDKLVSFDMTLVEMELNIARLKKQKQEQDLDKAVNRLTSLQNGGPVEEDDESPLNADNLGGDRDLDIDDPEGEDISSLGGLSEGNYLAAAFTPLLLAAFTDGASFDDGGESAPEGDAGVPEAEPENGGFGGSDSDIIFQDPVTDGMTDGEPEATPPEEGFESGVDDAPVLTPTPTPALSPGTEYYDPYTADDKTGFSDGEETFYQVLDYTAQPFAGAGTEEDPYIFLCSAAKGKVKVMGSFFNLMAGYNEDGTKVEKEGGSWFQLEFHENDTIADYQDRKISCTGYYLIHGSLLTNPVNMYSEMELTLEGAEKYEEEIVDDDGEGDMDWGEDDSSDTTITREEAIKIQQNRIASLKLDIQESDINIAKLERKVNRKLVTSKIDGVVSKVGDPLTGTSTGNAFITVKSKDGYYVRGSVSELLLDKVKEGTLLSCTSFENGTFEAEVIDVSDYPVSSDSFYGEGNPNVSYYTYSATITDKSIQVSDQDWLTVSLKTDAAKDGIVLSKAFVRSDNGENYVYKDDGGVLKKQDVNVSETVDGGYSVLISSGITRDDKIAFPYGKDTVDGTRTKDATLEEMYGY